MTNRFTEGLEKVGERYRIYEDVSVSKANIVEVTNNDGTITEATKDGKKHIKSYRMNVWEIGKKNLNKRCYDNVVDRVIQENAVTHGGVDHPKNNDDLDPARIFAVMSKPMKENGWLTVQVDLVGQYGQLVEDILDAGGSVGISSSCLGRLDENGYIINDESFLLERFGDFVTSPSNNFHHFKKEMEETTRTVESVIEQESTILEETNKTSIKLEEKEENMNEIKNLKLNLKRMVREAEIAENVESKLDLFNEALEYCDVPELDDIKESIVSKIEAINESVKEKAKKADVLEETVKEKEVEVSTVKETVAKKDKEVEILKKVTESIKADYNRNTAILEAQSQLKEEAESKVSILERDNAELIAKLSILERDNADLLKIHEAEKAEPKDDEKEMSDEEKAKAKQKAEDDKLKKDDEDKSKKEEKTDSKDDKEDNSEKPKDDEKDSKEDDEEKDKKDEKKKESFTSNEKARSFYIDSVKTNKTLIEHRAEILSCETLKEAQDIVLNLANKVEEKAKDVKHEAVDSKVKTGGIKSITEKYRKNWSL